MSPKNPFDGAEFPDVTDPEDVMDKAEPELREGPFGIPYIAPSGAPDVLDNSDDELARY